MSTDNKNNNNVSIKINTKDKKYELLDENGNCLNTIDIEKESFNKTSKREYLEKEFGNMIDENIKKNLRNIDINILKLYRDYDLKNGTKKAENYLCRCYDYKDMDIRRNIKNNLKGTKSIIENDKIIYDFTDSSLTRRQNKVLYNQKYNNKYLGLKVEDTTKEPKNKGLIKRIMKRTVAFLMGGLLIFGAGDSIIKGNKYNMENKNEITDTLNPEEGKETIDNKEQENPNVEIGSKATLSDEKYYETSNKTGNVGTMEEQDKDVTVTRIAVEKDNEILLNKEDSVNTKDLQEQYKDANVRLHIKTNDSDLGWVDYDEVKDKFAQAQEDKEVEETEETQEELKGYQKIGNAIKNTYNSLRDKISGVVSPNPEEAQAAEIYGMTEETIEKRRKEFIDQYKLSPDDVKVIIIKNDDNVKTNQRDSLER